MGNLLLKFVLTKKPTRLLMVGLDAAGKTTILYRLKLGEAVHTVPTIGFNVESVEFKNFKMIIWDVGGQDKTRPLWRHYYQQSQALIFVIDSADRKRIEEASAELKKMLEEEELRKCPLLIFANKRDQPNSMSAAEVAERLDLFADGEGGGAKGVDVAGEIVGGIGGRIRGRRWFVQSACALTGVGVLEGMEWLTTVTSGKG